MQIPAGALLLVICWQGAYQTGRTERDRGAVVSALLSQLRAYEHAGEELRDQRLVGFDLPEELVNAYLERVVHSGARPGIRSAIVNFLADGQIELRTVVRAPTLVSWAPEIGSQIGRRSELQLSFRLQIACDDSAARITVLAAEDNGGTLPEKLVAELFRMLALHQPERVDPTRPVPLPYGLKRVWVTKGMVHGVTR